MADLAGLKAWAVIGSDETDGELSLALGAAKQYAANAGVSEPESQNLLYDLLIYRLAGFWLDHRGFPEIGTDAAYVGIQGMIIQLREG